MISKLNRLCERLSPSDEQRVRSYAALSKSQALQDLFCLAYGWGSTNYFVEFGATDGLRFSNTYLLEKALGWNGVLAEPSKVWHGTLALNRGCNISFDCVFKNSGEVLEFLETSSPTDDFLISSPELSGLSSTLDPEDWAYMTRLNNSRSYSVITTSLTDLLDKFRCPSSFSYLSVDTEGSELECLMGLDFERFRPRCVTIEHNGIQHKRNKIFSFLKSLGYERYHEDISGNDDWYVSQQ